MTTYLTSFGSKTLHNGSTHHNATGVNPDSTKAKLDLIELANGVLFDPNGTGPAPTVPQPIKVEIVLKYSTAAAAETEAESIVALVGTRNTLTAKRMAAGTTRTCLARLEQVIDRRRYPQEASREITLELHFQPLNNWS